MKHLISLALALLLVLSVPAAAWAEGDTEADTETAQSGSIFDLLADSHLDYQIDLVSYYLTEMYNAAVAGDAEAGRAAETNRNELIDVNGLDTEKIAYDDLCLLSRLIYCEAGSDWLSDDFRMCVGEVVMNRVASPEFPNSIREVIYQKGQYSAATAPGFDGLVPSEECVSVALRLLQGERKMAESVVFQSNYVQGELFTVYSDRRLGSTYFCVSPNLELYPIE